MKQYLLATAAYSNPELLKQCIDSWPELDNVDTLVVNDKGKEQISLYIVSSNHNRVDFHACLPNHVGCSGSWNYILKNLEEGDVYDAVIVVGSDTIMKLGFLEGFIQEFEDKELDFAKTRGFDWNCWTMTWKGLQTVGYFDTNFYPAYFEDNDVNYRINLSGIKQDFIGDQELFSHYGSATIRKDSTYSQANDVTFQMNQRYYIEKWGGPPGQETYTSPFNNPHKRITEWELNEEMRQEKYKLWNP